MVKLGIFGSFLKEKGMDKNRSNSVLFCLNDEGIGFSQLAIEKNPCFVHRTSVVGPKVSHSNTGEKFHTLMVAQMPSEIISTRWGGRILQRKT